MLSGENKQLLATALAALRSGDAGCWNALAPLSQLSADGTDITVDFTTEQTLGSPLIIARSSGAMRLPDGLTPRQREVALAVGQGLSNKQIGQRLGITPATVKDHVGALLAVAGCSSRAEFIAAHHAPMIRA